MSNPWSDTRRTSVSEPSKQDFLRDVSRWREIAVESDRERVTAIRRAVAKGLTQREIAEAAGLSLGTVNAIVNGPREMPEGWLRQALEEGRQR
jgi:DNA-binding NarL/FixJ family response regulator